MILVCVCVCVCVFIKLHIIHITAQSGPVILVFYATCINPPKKGSMILITKIFEQARQRGQCVCVCVKLHTATHFGPVTFLVILCRSHDLSSQEGVNDTYCENRCVLIRRDKCVCVYYLLVLNCIQPRNPAL